jgi:hypothetical protein
MKNIQISIITWAFALICSAATVHAQGDLPTLTVEVSVPDSSPKSTAYSWGTESAHFLTLDYKNTSRESVTIARFWFEYSGPIKEIYMEVGDRLVRATINSFGDYPEKAITNPVTIPAGGSFRAVVRVDIDAKSDYSSISVAWVNYAGIDLSTRIDYSTFYNDREWRVHAVVEEQAPIPAIKNSSGLQRLESTKAYGFVIAGDRFMKSRIMIRVAGPALASLGIRDGVSDPIVRVLNSKGEIVGDSNDWAPNLSDRFAQVGAFAFTRGSKDSAMEVELSPGSYTVEVRNIDQSQVGTYLIETYQMPIVQRTPIIVSPPVQVTPGKG